MEAQKLHRGRLIDHVQLVVRDIAAARRFYAAALEALDLAIEGEGDGYFYIDELFVSQVGGVADLGRVTGPTHLAFQAKDSAAVDRFHAAALAAGGRDNGAPGERSYHPGYYAAFVLDPDGNNIEAVFHGAHQRSAPSVTITFEA